MSSKLIHENDSPDADDFPAVPSSVSTFNAIVGTPLADLRAYTPARISLARTGSSIATRDTLAFALDHAQARDAVHAVLSLPTLLDSLGARGLPSIAVKSAAPDRKTYLRRPDLGRKLSENSAASLVAALLDFQPDAQSATLLRLCIIFADGLSALAVDRHAIPVLDALLPHLSGHFEIAPIIIAEQARVALGDEIGAALHAQLSVVLIGERPGLSAADSLGAYITWHPAPGRTNAERNCISNIRADGLPPAAAATRIAFFLNEAVRLRLTGIALKDPGTSDLHGLPSFAQP